MEPAMGAKEYCRFLAVCTACVGCAAFVSMLFVYYGRRDEKLLYEPFCGFHGVVASLLVAVRQLMPDAPVNFRGLRTFKCRHLPAIHLGAMTLLAAALGRYLEKFGFTFFGGYAAWVYLRYYQPRPDGQVGRSRLGAHGVCELLPGARRGGARAVRGRSARVLLRAEGREVDRSGGSCTTGCRRISPG